MRFIKLTLWTTEQPVWINPEPIEELLPEKLDRTRIYFTGRHEELVRETPEQIIEAIVASGFAQ